MKPDVLMIFVVALYVLHVGGFIGSEYAITSMLLIIGAMVADHHVIVEDDA